jgi:hypothetical protein
MNPIETKSPALGVSLQTSAFARSFVDVADVNAHVSTALTERVIEVMTHALEGKVVPSQSFVVLGPAGGGKTHVFSRLQHLPGVKATLVLLRPFFGVRLTPRDVLTATIDQLCVPAPQAATSRMAGLSAFWLGSRDAKFPLAAMDEFRNRSSEEQDQQVDTAVARILQHLPDAAPAAHLIRALLRLESLERAELWRELAWLSGREPRAREPRAREPRAQAAEAFALSESDVLQLLRMIAVMAAPVAPLVVAIDQLENLAGDDETRVLSFGNMVAELVDTVPSLTLAQLAITSEWLQYIEPRLSLPQKTRVSGKVLNIAAPSREQRDQLLRAWYAHLGPMHLGTREYPGPISAADLEGLLVAPGMTPRLLLSGLTRLLAGEPAFEDTSRTQAAHAAESDFWDSEVLRAAEELAQKTKDELPVDAGELAEAMMAALSFGANVVVTTRSERERVLTTVCTPGHELTVVYVNGTHHSSVGRSFARAAELAELGKTVIVREKRLSIPSSWDAVNERRKAFEAMANARWLWLDPSEVAQGIALARTLSRARAGRLRHGNTEEAMTEGQLREHVQRKSDPNTWRPVVALLAGLTDVPRAAPQERASGEKLPMPTPAPIPPVASAVPSVREWLQLGKQVGVSAMARYREKLRTYKR